MHMSTACPGDTPPGQTGKNKGEFQFGILATYSALGPRRNCVLISKVYNVCVWGGGWGLFVVAIS
jgi:hypothetical protein